MKPEIRANLEMSQAAVFRTDWSLWVLEEERPMSIQHSQSAPEWRWFL